MIEFIFNNFFLIAKLIIYTEVVLCVVAVSAKRSNNKKINNKLTRESTDIRDNYISNDKEKISKHNGILMGFGVTTIVVGIILFVVGVLAIIFVIYVLVLLKDLFDRLG
ncbi:MAG: hypothetical protein ACOYWZ_07845 [Bacillota bacterium]